MTPTPRPTRTIPDAFVHETTEREGAAGAAWLAELPGIVAELLDRWSCVPDGEVTHGAVGLIVPVRRRGAGAGVEGEGEGEAAVLKVSFPHPGNVHEPDAFAVWGGRGAVRLYERDDERFAMLLERASSVTLAESWAGAEAGTAHGNRTANGNGSGNGSGNRDGNGSGTANDTGTGSRVSDALATVAGRLSRRLAVPAPPGLPRLADQAATWEAELRCDDAELAHSLPRRTVDAALATVHELARTQPDLMLHGDFHARNILRAEREPWLAVDPKGCAGDPAYDGGSLLKARVPALLEAPDLGRAVHRLLDVYAEAAELDRERVRRWSQLHAVQAAFWGRRHGFRLTRARSAHANAGTDPLVRAAEHLAQLLTD